MKISDFSPPSIRWHLIELSVAIVLALPLTFTLPVSISTRADSHKASEKLASVNAQANLMKASKPITVIAPFVSCSSGEPIDESYLTSHVLIQPQLLPLPGATPNTLKSSDGVVIGYIHHDRIDFQNCNTAPSSNENKIIQATKS